MTISTPDTLPVSPEPQLLVSPSPLDDTLLEARDYWRERLRAHAPFGRLTPSGDAADAASTGPDAVSTDTAALDTVEIALDGRILEDLDRLTSRDPFLLYTALLAVIHICLGRYTGSTNILTGSPALRVDTTPRDNSRGHSGSRGNIVALVERVDRSMAFRTFVPRLRQTLLDAYARQAYPFVRLLGDLNFDPQSSSTILFDVLVSLRGFHEDPPAGAHGLSLLFERDTRTLRGTARFNKRLLTRESAAMFLCHAMALLEDGLRRPDTAVARLDMAPAEELRRSAREWNTHASAVSVSPVSPAVSPERVIDAIARHVAETPDAVAVVCDHDTLTYDALNARATQLACALRDRGVGAEVRVGVCLERSLDLIVALLGIWKAGGAYVPLDPTYPPARLTTIVASSQMPLVLTQERIEDHVPNTWAQVLRVDADWDELAESEPVPLPAVDERCLAYLIYTSGSTGTPKGVAVTRGSVAHLVAGQVPAFALDRGQRVLQYASVGFDASVSEIFTTLASGAVLELIAQDELRSGDGLALTLRQRAITAVTLPPSVLRGLDPGATPALATVVSAGESCSIDVARTWRAGRRFINAYGPTEATVCATLAADAADDDIAPIGRSLPGTQVYVLDAEYALVAPGVPGEIYVGGPGVARGYWRQAGQTADRFVPDPFSDAPGARLYRTGDLARLRPDGNLEFLGRRDTQVKIRSFRIELGEIEAALRLHGAIQDAVVVVREDDQNGPQLVAYVVWRDAAVESSALHAFLLERLPAYMTPAIVVPLAALPLTIHGKADRAALPAPSMKATASYEAPRTAVEEILTSMWADLLGRPRVGVQDNFFELGGHSLLATQVVSRVRDVLGVDVPLRAIFETPTVQAVAQLVAQARQSGSTGTAYDAIPRADRTAPLPLSFAQQRMWMLEQLQPGQALYNVPLALRLDGSLDARALEHSLTTIVARHESLRTRFTADHGVPVQTIDGPWAVSLPVLDWRGDAADARQARIDALQRTEATTPFDLPQGRLLRAQLVRLADREHILFLTLHHIISDGWSVGVLLRELTTIYAGAVRNAPVSLRPMPIQYADVAVWQRARLQGSALDDLLAYWRTQLDDAPLTELPTDSARAATAGSPSAVASVRIDADLHRRLRQICAREGVTMFMLAASGFAVLLGRYTGQDDIVVGSPVAGRTRSETEDVIGCFVNTLVLRTRLAGNPSVRALLAQVRRTALDAYAHQDLPFERIVEELQPQRDLDRSPLFRILFALQNAPLPSPGMADLRVTPFEGRTAIAKFDINVSVVERPDGLTCLLQYNHDLFNPATAERLLDNYTVLLASMADDPACGVFDLSMLSAGEIEQLTAWSES